MCADWWWKLNICINCVGIVCPLLVSCVGSRGLGLEALVSGGGWVSQWSAVVAVWSFQVERGERCRCAAVVGGFLFFVFVSQGGVWHQWLIWGRLNEKINGKRRGGPSKYKRNIIYMPAQVLV